MPWAPGVQLLGLPLPSRVAQGEAVAVAVCAAGAWAGCAPVLCRAGLAERPLMLSAKLPWGRVEEASFSSLKRATSFHFWK